MVGLIYLSFQKVLRREDEEHIVRGAAAEDVLHLLPEVGEHQQLGEVGADQGGAGDRAAGDVGPVGAVQAIADRRGLGAHAAGERGLVGARMAPEDEVQGVEDRVGREDVRILLGKEIMAVTEGLDVPAGAPDARAVRDPVRGLGRLGIQPVAVAQQRLAERGALLRVLPVPLHLLLDAGDVPGAIGRRSDHRIPVVHDEIEILLLAGGQVQLDRELHAAHRAAAAAGLRLGPGLVEDAPGYLHAVGRERVVQPPQRAGGSGDIRRHPDTVPGVGEYPPVVVVAEDAVGHRGGVAEQGVLA